MTAKKKPITLFIDTNILLGFYRDYLPETWVNTVEA